MIFGLNYEKMKKNQKRGSKVRKIKIIFKIKNEYY